MKKLIINILFAAIALSATAQEKSFKKYELLLRGGVGSSFLQQDVSNAGSKSGIGGNIGLGCNYFFTQNWGVGTGLELGFYNSKTTSSNLSGSYDAIDPDKNENFTYRYQAKNFEEKQSATLLTIPILINFQTGSKYVFYGSAGLRFGIPVSKKFNQTTSELTTSGYYPADGNTYYNIPEAGFMTTNGYSASGDIELKTSCILSAEAGMKWSLGNRLGLYTGLYIDYGLNNIQKTSNKEVFQYQEKAPATIGSGSILNSSATSSVRTVSGGVRIGIFL